MIINAGIKEVVYETEYHFTEQARGLFEAAQVTCRRFTRT
jgi:deoxycytidylate deaminase